MKVLPFLYNINVFLNAGVFSGKFNHWLPSWAGNKTESKKPFLGIDGKLTSIGNDTLVKLKNMLKDNNETKAKGNVATAKEHAYALLGELKQQLNNTASNANRLLPASKGEIDQQNLIINRLVMQINALTLVSGIASAV